KTPTLELERGDFDIGMAGFFTQLHGRLYRSKLFDESFLGMIRKDHPLFKKSRITLQDYVAFPHLLISPHGTLDGIIDQALEKRGLERNVQFGIANFQTPGKVIERTDLILTAPARLIKQFC